MKKSVSKAYMVSGVILTLAGIFCALILPQAVAYATGTFLGVWTNIFYLAVILGVYRILVYAVSSHQRGRNPQKYYNNLIDYGMMKFQGASVVRNMLVATLLLFGALFSIAYLSMYLTTMPSDRGYEAEFSYRYLDNADEPTERELNRLAEESGISLKDYREAGFLRVFGSGVERDADENNQLIENYYERYAQYDVTCVSEFERLTGITLDIPSGSYYQIIGSSSYENIWHQFGDMDQLYIESEETCLPLSYAGNVTYESLSIGANNNMDTGSRFVVNDADYERLRSGLPDNRLETQVLFNTEGALRDKISFSYGLFREFADRMSDEMDVMDYYDAAAEERNGAEYTETFGEAIVDPGNPLRAADWQFRPLMVPVIDQQLLLELSTRLLMFTYIFIICIAAVGVIGYTRSQSVGLANRQVFEDIERLGADVRYRSLLMKKQLRRVFVLPTCLGTGLCLLYEALVQWNNDKHLSSGEITSLTVLALIALAVMVYQYLIYRLSVRKTRHLLHL